MYRCFLVGVIVLFSLFMTSCGIDNKIDFGEVVENINNYNENIKVPDLDFSEYINETYRQDVKENI